MATPIILVLQTSTMQQAFSVMHMCFLLVQQSHQNQQVQNWNSLVPHPHSLFSPMPRQQLAIIPSQRREASKNALPPQDSFSIMGQVLLN